MSQSAIPLKAPSTATGRSATIAASAMLALSALCWSGNHVIARAVRDSVPSWSLNTARWVVVALLMLLFAGRRLREDWPVMRQHWLVLAFLGAVGGGVFGALQFVGLRYTGALTMGVMNSVAPALIALASFAIFRDRIGPLQIIGIAVSIVGVIAIVSKLDLRILSTLDFNKGDLIIVMNMGLWAIYSACLRLRPKIAVTSFLFALAASAAIVSLPISLLEAAAGNTLHFDATTLGTVAYSSLISSILAYVCWGRGIETLGVTRAGVFLHLVPVFGALLATTLLGERLGTHHLVGFALIMTGVTLAAGSVASPVGATNRT